MSHRGQSWRRPSTTLFDPQLFAALTTADLHVPTSMKLCNRKAQMPAQIKPANPKEVKILIDVEATLLGIRTSLGSGSEDFSRCNPIFGYHISFGSNAAETGQVLSADVGWRGR